MKEKVSNLKYPKLFLYFIQYCTDVKEPKFPEKTEVEFEDPDETIHIYTHCVWLKRIKTPRKIISEFPGINYAHLHRVS